MTQTKSKSKSPAKATEAPRYERSLLIARAPAVVGCASHTLVGALKDLRGNGPITIAQAQTAVDKYRKREVREDS